MSKTLKVDIQLNDDTMMTIDIVCSSETETSETEICRFRARKVDGTAFASADLLRLGMNTDWSWIEKVPETDKEDAE